MLNAQELARMLAPSTAKDQILLGQVTGTTGSTVQFVLDGEDPTSPDTRTAATFTGSSFSTGSRIVLARINSSYVALGTLAS